MMMQFNCWKYHGWWVLGEHCCLMLLLQATSTTYHHNEKNVTSNSQEQDHNQPTRAIRWQYNHYHDYHDDIRWELWMRTAECKNQVTKAMAMNQWEQPDNNICNNRTTVTILIDPIILDIYDYSLPVCFDPHPRCDGCTGWQSCGSMILLVCAHAQSGHSHNKRAMWVAQQLWPLSFYQLQLPNNVWYFATFWVRGRFCRDQS